MRRDAPQAWPYSADLYRRALAFASGYRDKLEKADSLIQQAPEIDGQPRKTSTSDPVAAAAERREKVTGEIRIIEEALRKVPVEYRPGVLMNTAEQVPAYVLREKGVINASDSTIYAYRNSFLSWIVVLAGWDVHWSLLEDLDQKIKSE